MPETARPKAEHRRPKADLMRVDALGAQDIDPQEAEGRLIGLIY